jgi:hypothetical protein
MPIAASANTTDRVRGGAPRVSVLLPAYNAAGTIEPALRSALDQSLTNLEVIVVDDASSDGTAAIVADLAAQDPRLRLLRAPRNGGAAAARNRAIEAAQGDWLALLDADDGFAAGRLERLVGLGEHRGADIVADNLSLVRADGRVKGCALAPDDPVFDGPLTAAAFVARNHFLGRGFTLGYLKPLFRRGFLRAEGLRQDESLRIAEDFHFLLAALMAGGRCLVDRHQGYAYRLTPGSLSRGLSLADLEQLAKANAAVTAQPAAKTDPALRAALARRQVSLERNIHFARFVEALKGRRLAEAGSIFARHPDLTPFLAFFGMQSLCKRLPGGRRFV